MRVLLCVALRRSLLVSLMVLVLSAGSVLAGAPHFVFCSASVSGMTLTADGKEAGLGNETQVHLVLSADAACVNPGNNKPQAANKQSVTAEGDFPVQNGKALFSLDATATFQPPCSPPMHVEFRTISVCDTAHGVCCTLD
jgi:hypothetical protein